MSQAAAGETAVLLCKLSVPSTRVSTNTWRPVIAPMLRATVAMSLLWNCNQMLPAVWVEPSAVLVEVAGAAEFVSRKGTMCAAGGATVCDEAGKPMQMVSRQMKWLLRFFMV